MQSKAIFSPITKAGDHRSVLYRTIKGMVSTPFGINTSSRLRKRGLLGAQNNGK